MIPPSGEQRKTCNNADGRAGQLAEYIAYHLEAIRICPSDMRVLPEPAMTTAAARLWLITRAIARPGGV